MGRHASSIGAPARCSIDFRTNPFSRSVNVIGPRRSFEHSNKIREDSMKWVTRANVKVDRVACPWLIRTFIDRDAEFLFVPSGEVESVARTTGAIPYDVAGVELGHHGEECSFDAIVKKYNVKDDAIGRRA